MVRLLSRTPAKIPHVILHPASIAAWGERGRGGGRRCPASAAASQNVACARGAVVATLPDDPVGRARLAILRSLPPHTQRPDVAIAAAATTIGPAPPPANRRLPMLPACARRGSGDARYPVCYWCDVSGRSHRDGRVVGSRTSQAMWGWGGGALRQSLRDPSPTVWAFVSG